MQGFWIPMMPCGPPKYAASESEPASKRTISPKPSVAMAQVVSRERPEPADPEKARHHGYQDSNDYATQKETCCNPNGP